MRWKKTPQDLEHLPKLQLEILTSAAKLLKADGILVYSTCTLEKSENEEVIKTFLETHADFKLDTMRTLLPHVDGTDGFFIAKLQKVAAK